MGHRLKECINAALWQRVHMWNVAHPMMVSAVAAARG